MNPSRQYYLEGFLAGTGRNGTVAAPAIPESAPASPHPMSWEEQTKRNLLPFDAFPRLVACAHADEPPSAADSFRFEWFGLLYQGPETDAWTARVRLPGGKLPGLQVSELARIVQELAGGWIEFNAQGGLDIPGVPVRAGVELLRRLEGVGLSTRGTGGDCVRTVRGGEREEVPMVRELEHALAHRREYGDLPGPCEVVFRTGREGVITDPQASIVFKTMPPVVAGPGRPDFWPQVLEPDSELWRVIVPGGGDLGIAFAAAETVPVCLALLRVWSRQADRETRIGAELVNFCRQLGSAGLREAVEKELGKRLALSPVPKASAATPVATPSDGFEVPGGRLLSGQMEALARAAARHGVVEMRIVGRKYLLAVPGSVGNATAFGAEVRRILSAGEFIWNFLAE